NRNTEEKFTALVFTFILEGLSPCVIPCEMQGRSNVKRLVKRTTNGASEGLLSVKEAKTTSSLTTKSHVLIKNHNKEHIILLTVRMTIQQIYMKYILNMLKKALTKLYFNMF
ncbi:hypothetical protein MOC31_21220, partial [Bacillus inaquosorum]|uniref:hypothetical protein n=1 Tax=Bacillus inaquosorum TaxID=483913 RepID=UPI0022827D5F